MSQLQFYLASKDATVPTKGSSGAAGWDLYAAEDTIIPPNGRGKVGTKIHVAFPTGYYARIASRSGLAYKYGIDVGAGVVDEDYRGEIGVILFNHGSKEFQVTKGQRIAQLLLEKIAEDITVTEVPTLDKLGSSTRGQNGFGSTDDKEINRK